MRFTRSAIGKREPKPSAWHSFAEWDMHVLKAGCGRLASEGFTRSRKKYG
jgi:hypothetical protein